MNTLTPSDYATYWNEAIPFQQYTANVEAEAATNPTVGNSKYVPINWKRMQRITKTTELSGTALQVVAGLKQKVNWLVITENWCGDSAQSTPIMEKLVEASKGMIELRFIYRDTHPELMNAHLTGTSMSIPKLIMMDTAFNVMDVWGPRPEKAQQMVLRLLANPATKATYHEELHKWYADDKQISIEAGLLDLLKEVAAPAKPTV